MIIGRVGKLVLRLRKFPLGSALRIAKFITSPQARVHAQKYERTSLRTIIWSNMDHPNVPVEIHQTQLTVTVRSVSLTTHVASTKLLGITAPKRALRACISIGLVSRAMFGHLNHTFSKHNHPYLYQTSNQYN